MGREQGTWRIRIQPMFKLERYDAANANPPVGEPRDQSVHQFRL